MAAAASLSSRGNRERSTATASRQRTVVVVVVVSPVVGISVSYCELYATVQNSLWSSMMLET